MSERAEEYEYRLVCPDGNYEGWRFRVFGEAVNMAARCSVAHGGAHPVERTVIEWEAVTTDVGEQVSRISTAPEAGNPRLNAVPVVGSNEHGGTG